MNRKRTILIVDDVELNRALLQDMLEDEFQILEASNGLEAIEHLRGNAAEISLVLLDAIMPEMDGFEVLEEMNRQHWIDAIPVVMISAETSPDFITKGYQLGASDYISRPYSAAIVLHRVKNTILLFAKQMTLQNIVTEQIQEREDNNSLMVDVLSAIVGLRNGESGLHVRRIRIITEILLKALVRNHSRYELSESEIAEISNAAALHDVGKIMVPEEILNKPGKLTPEEFSVIKDHSAKGALMLENIQGALQKPMIRYAHDICRWHHERWDGGGYPDGLKGNEIPLWAQAVSLADVYDALVSPRVYKPAYSTQQAMQMILNGECGLFNPDLLSCLQQESIMLEQQIQMQEVHSNQLFDVEKISKEVIARKDPSVSDRTIWLLEQERIKYQFFASLSNEILFEYDLQTDTLSFSEGGAQILNIPMQIPVATQWAKSGDCMNVADYQKINEQALAATPENPLVKGRYVILSEGKQAKWFELTMRTLWTEGLPTRMSGCIGKLVDIHKQQTEQERLKFLAESDSLTGLYNHTTAQEKISKLLSGEGLSALLLFDVDNFKSINDTYGHMTGDGVLKQLANHILSKIRATDIVARIGGDEFLVFLNGFTDLKQLEELVAALWNAMRVSYDGHVFTVSAGVAVYPKDGTDYGTLFSHADKALYVSKKQGKNRCVFFE